MGSLRFDRLVSGTDRLVSVNKNLMNDRAMKCLVRSILVYGQEKRTQKAKKEALKYVQPTCFDADVNECTKRRT
jgi:hypothetical protein